MHEQAVGAGARKPRCREDRRAGAAQIVVQRVECRQPHHDDPLDTALADELDRALTPVDLVQAQVDQLAGSQPRGIKDFEDGAVAHTRGGGKDWLRQQSLDRLVRGHVAQAPRRRSPCHLTHACIDAIQTLPPGPGEQAPKRPLAQHHGGTRQRLCRPPKIGTHQGAIRVLPGRVPLAQPPHVLAQRVARAQDRAIREARFGQQRAQELAQAGIQAFILPGSEAPEQGLGRTPPPRARRRYHNHCPSVKRETCVTCRRFRRDARACPT